jgi:hypothetical protein
VLAKSNIAFISYEVKGDMPPRDKHLGMAALIATPISLAILAGYVLIDIETSKGSWAIFAVFVDFFAVIISAIFPDILEPPKSARMTEYDQSGRTQTHRQRWHSWEILGTTSLIAAFSLLLGMNLLASTQFTLGTILMTIGCFSLGYAVHLWQDSYMAPGLPIRFILTAKILKRVGIP